jgi:YegS/Rv2252/BmrU family lipid kinase
MKKIAFIIHGKVRNKQKIIKEIESTFFGNYKIAFFISEYSGHAIELSNRATQEGFNYIICVGGDGSLNEVVNGVMQAKNRNKELDVKVGVLPFGTGNDFIKTIKSPDTFSGIKKLIDDNSFKEIDLGIVHFKNHKGQDSLRYFINITDIGIGGVVVQNLGKYSKALGGNITYMMAIINTLLSYRNQPVKAIADEFTFEGKVKNFVVANGKYFGSGIGIAPDAELDDGKFAIVILAEVSLIDFLKFSVTFKKCVKIDHPQIIYKSAKEITVESLSIPQPIDMDGEFIGYSPMNIKILSRVLSFLCPL